MSIKSNLLTDVYNLAGVKRFDRKKESLNKIKHRMKGIYNKGPKKTGLSGGIQGTSLQTASSQGQNELYHQQTGQQLYQMIEKFVSENPQDFGNMLEPMRKAASIRYREYIRETLAENSKKNYFVRIYPAKGSDIYDSYFSGPRTYNKILYKALYTDEVMRCTQPKPTTDMKLGYKIDIPPTSYDQYRKQQQDRVQSQQQVTQQRMEQKPVIEPTKDAQNVMNQVETVQRKQANQAEKERPVSNQQPAKHQEITSQQQNDTSLNSSVTQTINKQSTSQSHQNHAQQPQTSAHSQSTTQEGKSQEKVLITGDDILIEYVERLMNCIKNVPDDHLQDSWKVALEKFITHYVWHSQDRRGNAAESMNYLQRSPFWFRLEGRLSEMQERRRRLIKYLYKKEGKLNEFEEGFKHSINKKSTIIKKFTSAQLEDLLRTSTKNVAQEVVSSLIPPQGGGGVLADIDRLQNGKEGGSSNSRKSGAVMVKKPMNRATEEEEPLDSFKSNQEQMMRGSSIRQSKSANGARSMTRKNQQQLQQEDVFPNASAAKHANLLQAATNTDSSRLMNNRAGTLNLSASRHLTNNKI